MEQEYVAEYTILINGATWGTKDISFYAENEEEALDKALELEKEYSSPHEELLLNYVYNENGEMIEEE